MIRVLLVLVFLSLTLPVKAQDAPNILPTVQQLRADYPARMSPAQVGELLNRIAWAHRAEGWGLLRKTGGTMCPVPQGGHASCDILIHAPSVRHFDVLADAESVATPVWRDVGPCVLGPSSGCAMANYLAPVQPAGSPEPGPTPQPDPVPVPDPNIPRLFEQVKALTQTVEALRMWADERVAAQHARLEALAADLSTLTARVDLLERRPIPMSCSAGLNLGIRIPISCRLE